MPTETEATLAYRKLRDLIIRTELKPGSPLVEAELMRRLGVGRTPLRDALHKLDHEGLAAILPRRGTFVSPVTVSDLQQIFEVRSGLEDIVAKLAVERRTEDHLNELATMVEVGCRQSGSDESDVELDRQLHALLLRIARNHLLDEMYRRVADASLRLLYLTKCGMESRDEQCATLRMVYDALDRRDSPLLAECLRAHIRAFRDRVARSIFSTADFMMDQPGATAATNETLG